MLEGGKEDAGKEKFKRVGEIEVSTIFFEGTTSDR